MSNITPSQQVIYINLDDSGKLSKKESVCVYGGIVFFNKQEKDKFITQYRSIVNDIKCRYCKQSKDSNCGNNCTELKSYNLKSKHKRRILNYIKKYYTIGCIIKNENVYDYIIKEAASKGRFLDYSIRRLIKSVIINLINKKIINPHKPIRLIINIDEQSTKNNGYYDLKEGIREELLHGIYNFNYNTKHQPIIFGDFEIKLTYQHSDTSYVVQAADLIAGTIRHEFIAHNDNPIELTERLKIIDFKLFLP